MRKFIELFNEHRHHFLVSDSDPRHRTLGFWCADDNCGATIKLSDLGAMRILYAEFVDNFISWHNEQWVRNYFSDRPAQTIHLITPNYERLNELALKRSLRLLKRNLTRMQRKELLHLKEFNITGADGRSYRIEQAIHGNVVYVNNGKDIARYCASPELTPVFDVMLAQKLLLESVPEEFHRVANVTIIEHGLPLPVYDTRTNRIIEVVYRRFMDQEIEGFTVRAHENGMLITLERTEENGPTDEREDAGRQRDGGNGTERRYEDYLEQEQRGGGRECEEDIRRSA